MAKMIKVLLLHNYESPYRGKLFNQLGKYVKLTVIYLEDKSVDNRRWTINGSQNYSKHYVKSYQLGKLALNRPSEFRDMIKDDEYDVVILSDNLPNFFSNMYVSLIARSTRKLLWSEEVAVNPCYPRFKRSILMLSQWFLSRKVDGVVAFTKSATISWEKQLKDKKVFYCCQSSLTSEELKFYNLPKKSKELRLLFIGSFTGRKNEDVMCQAVAELAKDHNIQLTLVGEGPLRKHLIKKYSSPFLTFLGWKEHITLGGYYRNHHFLILPSRYDTWGMVVNESMSIGTPTIVSKCVGARELVKDSGFIIKHLNKDKLKEVLLRAYYLDGENYYALRKKAFEYSKNYTIEISAKHFLHAIEEISSENITYK